MFLLVQKVRLLSVESIFNRLGFAFPVGVSLEELGDGHVEAGQNVGEREAVAVVEALREFAFAEHRHRLGLRIEHRLFSQISATWAGHVLCTLVILLGYIRRTTTATGLKVTATHFDRIYRTGLKVSKAEFAAIRLTRHAICPQWNYTIRPNPKLTE